MKNRDPPLGFKNSQVEIVILFQPPTQLGNFPQIFWYKNNGASPKAFVTSITDYAGEVTGYTRAKLMKIEN